MSHCLQVSVGQHAQSERACNGPVMACSSFPKIRPSAIDVMTGAISALPITAMTTQLKRTVFA